MAVPSCDSADAVELTDEELAKALMQARREKFERMRKDESEQFRQQLRAAYTRPWTWQEMLQFVRHRAGEVRLSLVVDERNERILEALCRYFTNDAGFEKMDPDWRLHKGLLLMGGVGTGKTTLLKLFCRNPRQCFDVISARTAADMYERDGDKAIEIFSDTRNEFGQDIRFFYHTVITQCFDDLGTEKIPIMHYGNKTNVMENILLNRYDKGVITHVTTNLLPEDLEDKYGTRVRSRVKEMFNLIRVTGDDRRK